MKFQYLIFLIHFLFSSILYSQNVTGKVTDESGNPLIGANVYIEDTYIGTTTNIDGQYYLETDLDFPYILVVSYIGYDMKKIEVNSDFTDIALVEKAFMANEVVVAASRIKESYLSAPVSVEKLDLLDIKRTPSVSFYDALDNLKEVEMKTGSVLYKSMNARGFGGTTNPNFIQLIDGANSAPITSGQFALGNMNGIPEIDIASIELLPGAASALYGPNAYSGIMFINSKTPFFYQGLSAIIKSGMHSEDEAGSNPFYDISFRYAKAFEKFAFKTSFSKMQAHDWHSYDESFVSDGEGNISMFNKVNIYGDEIGSVFNLDDLAGAPEGYFQSTYGIDPIIGVGRTGYTENDLYDYNAHNTKFSSSFQYKITDDLIANYIFRWDKGQTLFQSLNKYILDGIQGRYHQIDLKSSNLTLRATNWLENAGEAYDLLFTSFNINKAAKSDGAWFQDYLGIYLNQVQQPLADTQAGLAYYGIDVDMTLYSDIELQNPLVPFSESAARQFADYGGYLNDGVLGIVLTGDPASTMTVDDNPDFWISTAQSDAQPRFEPGSDEFNNALQNSIDSSYAIGGSGFESKSSYQDFEAMYDFEDKLGVVNLLIGGNYKMYRPKTNGSIYSDSPEIEQDHGLIRVDEWGTYAQISKLLLDDRLKLQASYRLDGHSNFETHGSPRFSVVYSINDIQHLRMSYQSGFTNPTLQTQYLAINLGVQHNIGGAEDNLERLGLTHLYKGNENGVYGIRDADNDGIIVTQFDNDGDGIFDSTWFDGEQLNYVQPEYQKSFEVGYKGLVTPDIYVDVNYYTSEYTNPTVGYRVGDPNQVVYNDDGSIDSYKEYVISTNKEGIDRLHGGGIAVTYNLSNGWRIGANTNYIGMNISLDEANIQQTDRPEFRHKFSLSNPNIFNNLGFSLAGRYTDKYNYSSSSNFGNGELGGETIIDAQLTYTLLDFNTTFKLGVNNLLGKSYRQAIGGVYIGQTMYLSMNFDKLY